MPTGPEALASLQTAIQTTPGNERWLEIQQKLDLCKLTATELTDSGFDSTAAAEIVSALDQQDVEPLGRALGLSLRTKFRVFAAREPSKCKIRCQGEQNAVWMRDYLRSELSNATVMDPQPIDDTPLFRVDVELNADATAFAVQRALLDCPAALLMQMFDVRVHEQPHFRVSSENLSAWVDDQGEDSEWIVDGDAYLMSRLEFPASHDELARELRSAGKPLLVADPNETGAGEEVTPDELDRVVEIDERGNRTMTLTWEGGDSDWQLVEEELTSESSGL